VVVSEVLLEVLVEVVPYVLHLAAVLFGLQEEVVAVDLQEDHPLEAVEEEINPIWTVKNHQKLSK